MARQSEARICDTMPLKFFFWLLAQGGRDDDIGTIARHAALDRAFPRSGFLLAYTDYIQRVFSDDTIALQAMKTAWAEWIEQRKHQP